MEFMGEGESCIACEGVDSIRRVHLIDENSKS
jgi:hypothetical protein